MEVVPAPSDSSPFQRRDVAEWSHMDRLTGMMETARVETDRWAASTPTSAHAYGKVVDSRNRSLPDGSAQQRQRQQLEVFQTKGPGGSLQVIRTQTVTSTNSSWRGTTSFAGSRAPLPSVTQDFGNLQLTLNPLDLSSVKSKGSVGRSGSIGGRRPPSRPRSLILAPRLAIEEDAVSSQSHQQLAQVRRICQQSHDDTKKTLFNGSDRPATNTLSLRELSSSTSSKASSIISNGHSSISRKKSSSIEDLHNGSAEVDEEEGSLTRSSKVRRSLQFPLKKLEARGGVSKILQDLEENKRNDIRIARKSFEALENVLKRGNNIIDTLSKSEDSDSLQTGSETSGEYNSKHTVNNINLESLSRRLHTANKFSFEKRYSLTDASDSKDEQESSNDEGKNKSPATKRHSFVSVESLKEVRGRLKKLNSPLDGLDMESGLEEVEDNDDGIETEDNNKSDNVVVEAVPSRVRSYVYGMEAISRSNRQPVLGTGSLESRTSSKNNNNNRSDEWYNRRKSYGFEKVTSDQTNDSSSTLSSNGERSKLESTDSGICRSSETFTVPSWNRKLNSNSWNKSGECDVLNVSHAIQLKRSKDDQHVREDEKENFQKKGTTVVNFGSKNEPSNDSRPTSSNNVIDIFKRKEGPGNLISALLVNGVRGDNSAEKGRNQHVTVSIPIVQDDSSPTVESRRLFYQQLAQGTTVSVERSSKKQVKTVEVQAPLSTVSKVGGDDWWLKPNVNSGDNLEDSKLGDADWRVPSKLLSSATKRHSFAGENAWKNINGNDNESKYSEEGSRSGGGDWRQILKPTETEMKRHSIAVDESKYVKENSPVSTFNVSFTQQVREDSDILASKKAKKVEFCKTEVHFAAEPGRFNIVETDEKPPSTNMFRRRRRQSNPSTETVKTSNLPEVRFGDSIYEKHLLGRNENGGAGTTVLAARPTSLRLELEDETLPDTDDQVYTESNATIRATDVAIIEKAEQQINFESSLESKPRSILKNYSKTQLQHFGENDDSSGEVDQDEKWGVRLRPVTQDRTAVWKPTVTLSSRDAVMPVEYSGQSELQKLLRSLRPANQRKHELMLATRLSGFTKTPETVSDWSVADRIRHVEQVASESKGFSTRVNFGAGEATVVDENAQSNVDANNRLYPATDRSQPVWQRREEDLMAKDGSKYDFNKCKALVVQIGQSTFETNRITQLSSATSSPDTEVARRNSTTTKITIGLPASSIYKDFTNGDTVNHHINISQTNIPQNGSLSSPSLIMKSVKKTVEDDVVSKHLFRKSCLSNFQGNKRYSLEMHSNSFVNGGSRSYPNDSKNWMAEYNLKCKTNSRRHSMAIGDRGIADGEVHPNNKEESSKDDHVNHSKHWRETEERDCDDVMVESRMRRPRKKLANTEHGSVTERFWSESDVGEKGSAEELVVAGQLGAWRALYCDIDSELSDDSEKADEEVRSYMSTEGEGGSEVSGSWSRVTALRHFQKHSQQERATGYAASESRTDIADSQQVHSSVTTAMIPSYGDSGKLRAVETLVSTRSGHPKITSIALRYEGDQNNSARQSSTANASDSHKFTSRTSISPDRRHSSYIETEKKSLPKETRSSTYFESSYQSQPQLFTQHNKSRLESNGSLSANKLSSYSVKTQIHNSQQRSSYSDRSSTEARSDYHDEKQLQPPAQRTVVTSENPAQTFSHLSAFDKRNSNSGITQSPSVISSSYSPSTTNTTTTNAAKHFSSSRMVSSLDRKDSNSSNNQRSPFFEEKEKQSQNNSRSAVSITNPRPQRHETSNSETSSVFDFNKSTSSRREAQTKKLSLFDSPSLTPESLHSSPSQSKQSLRESPLSFQEIMESRYNSRKVECEIGTVTKAMSVSPSPTKKVTSPSKNSMNKDFIGRVRSESPIDKEQLLFSQKRKLSPSEKHSNIKDISKKNGSQSPIYQNREVFTCDMNGSKRSSKNNTNSEIKLTECGLEAIETDSVILEELTRAAEQILQAVHGYTDDESRRASSDDDSSRNKLKDKRTLGTISETPSRKQSGVKKEALAVNGNSARRTPRTASKTKLGPTSSTSSVESVAREARRSGAKTERASSTSSKSATSTRAARMVQRANSRELLLQSHASSSEDVASGTDTKKPRAPPPRRSRTSTSANKVSATAATKPCEKQKESSVDISRTSRERVSSSKGKSREAMPSSHESRRKTPETKQYPVKEKTIPGIVSSSGRDRTSSSRTTPSGTRTKKTVSSRHDSSTIKVNNK